MFGVALREDVLVVTVFAGGARTSFLPMTNVGSQSIPTGDQLSLNSETKKLPVPVLKGKNVAKITGNNFWEFSGIC